MRQLCPEASGRRGRPEAASLPRARAGLDEVASEVASETAVGASAAEDTKQKGRGPIPRVVTTAHPFGPTVQAGVGRHHDRFVSRLVSAPPHTPFLWPT